MYIYTFLGFNIYGKYCISIDIVFVQIVFSLAVTLDVPI